MSQKSTIPQIAVWHINGFEFELDMNDVDSLIRYEKALKRLGENDKNLPKTGMASERVLAYCNMFRTFFDDIFGENASMKIIGEKNNARVITEIYEQFLEFAQSQSELFTQTTNRIIDRFSPNRAQRRAAAKGK